MNQRISAITLSTSNIARAIRFYKALGWKPGHTDATVAFFQMNGLVLALYDRKAYAKDYKLPLSRVKSGGVNLAQNQRGKKEVDAVIARAKKAGAKVLTKAHDTFWGGYAGCFADLDGHPWEIAWNPFWRIDKQGNTWLK